MSILEPPPDDDADLRALFDTLEEPDTSDVIDVTKLLDHELLDLLADSREKLLSMGEMLSDLENTYGTKAGTPEAREQHAIRLACLMEMSHRGMR